MIHHINKKEFEEDFYKLSVKECCYKYNISVYYRKLLRKKLGLAPSKRGRKPTKVEFV